MFTANLATFPQEKDNFRQKLLDISNRQIPDSEKEKQKEEAKEAFEAQVRQYLPSALGVIKELFNVQYSIHKVGKDYDANFHVVETNLRKTKPEVLADIENFKSQASYQSLTEEQLQRFNLAIDVLTTYTADAEETEDQSKNIGLQNAKVVASSIIEVPSRENNAFTPAPAETPQVNFNPYANQPIMVDEGFNNPQEGKKMIDDPFASLYGEGVVGGNVETEESKKTFIQDYNPDDNGITPGFGGNMYENTNGIEGFFQTSDMSIEQPSIIPLNPSINTGMDMNASYQQPMMPVSNMGYNEPMNTQSTFNQPMTPQPVMQPMMQQTPTMNMNPPMYQGVTSDPMNGYTNTPNDTGVSTSNLPNPPQEEQVLLERSRTDKMYIVSKLLTGFIRMPVLSAFAIGMAFLVLFVIQRAELESRVVEVLGEYYTWTVAGLVGITCFITASSILGPVSRKTKYVGKYMMTSLTIFAGLFYLFIALSPTFIEKFPKVVTDDFVAIVSIFCYLIGSLSMLGTFFSSDSDGKLKMNPFEKLGILWNLYVILIPTISRVCAYFKVKEVPEKINLFYDYPVGIIIAISFVLATLMVGMNVIEEMKARRKV